MSFSATLHQLRFPRAFRIHEPTSLPEVQEELSRLMDLLRIQMELETQQLQTEEVSSEDSNDSSRERFYTDLGTRLWRLRKRLLDPDGQRARSGLERPYRYFQSVWESLRGEQIEVVDHTGERFDPGVSLDVIAFEERADLREDTIIETIKPTIYYKDRRIQTGQVMVGTPPQSIH